MMLQWMDSAFPTGAFAHSGGLETYAQAEKITSPNDLARLIAVKLESAAQNDLIVVHCAMSAYSTNDRAQIAYLDKLCAASKLSRETREASEKIGWRMLGSVLNLIDDEALTFYRAEITARRCSGHHAVAHGLVGAAMNIQPQIVMLAFAYGIAANQTAASLKLMRIGQTQSQAVLHEVGDLISAAVDTALARTLDDFSNFTPGLDIRSIQHEHLFRRLFIS